MTVKKLISILAVALMVGTCLAAFVPDTDADVANDKTYNCGFGSRHVTGGTANADVVATFDGSTDTLTIEGQNNDVSKNIMLDYTTTGSGTLPPWKEYENGIKHVVINNVVYIGAAILYNFSKLEKVTIKDGKVNEVGHTAFAECHKLTTVEWDDKSSLEILGDFVFTGSAISGEFTLPASTESNPLRMGKGIFCLTEITSLVCNANYINYIKIESGKETLLSEDTIPTSTFEDCTVLASVTFADECKISKIGDNAFLGCRSLSTISIPESVTEIGIFAFHGCSEMTSADLSNVKTIGKNAFSSCWKLSDLTLPTVDDAKIGVNAFYACTALKEISIGSNIVSVGDYAFASTGLEKLKFSKSNGSTEYGVGVFSDCASLKSVKLSGLDVVSKSMFQNCRQLESVTTDGVKTIASSAFMNCSSLKSISIGSSVTSIADDAFGAIVFHDKNGKIITDLSELAGHSYVRNGNEMYDKEKSPQTGGTDYSGMLIAGMVAVIMIAISAIVIYDIRGKR